MVDTVQGLGGTAGQCARSVYVCARVCACVRARGARSSRRSMLGGGGGVQRASVYTCVYLRVETCACSLVSQIDTVWNRG
jgi:hypothetical protein